MLKCDLDNFIEITLRHNCSPANLLRIQISKNEITIGGGLTVCKKLLVTMVDWVEKNLN